MVNIGALDVVISMVVVLILLSLVVQSFQQLVKKVLKLKSRTIESSLADLLGKVVTPIGGGGGGAAAAGTVPGKALVAQVVDELKGLGRRSLFNSPMLDSIAKDDVLKVLTKIGAEAMYPKYQEKFLAIQQALDEVAKALGESQGAAGAGQAAVLTGSSSAKLAALEQALAPLAHDLSALIDQGGMVKAKAVLGDLLNVRRVQMQDLFTLLGEVQDRVQADIAAAQAAGKDTAGLQAVAGALRRAADGLRKLGRAIEDAVAPLGAKLNEVEVWYDTVMQGFDERYTRHMKTVAVAIATLTVIALNANFFSMYERMVKDPRLRGQLVATGETLRANRPPGTASPAAPGTGTTVEDVQQAAQEARQRVLAFEAFGFNRVYLSDLRRYWYEDAPWGPPAPGPDGRLRANSWTPWLGNGLNSLLGWLVTILLLSAGAPFWEDVLESLFGLKGLMRQKTATKNAEEGSGGQPKP